jgi:amino acid transporter
LAFKIFQRTPFHRAKDVDLMTDLDFFEALDEHYQQEKEAAPSNVKDKIMAKIF